MNRRIIAAILSLTLLCGCSAKPSSPGNPGSNAADASQSASNSDLPTMPPPSENPSLSNFKTVDINGEEVSQEIFSEYKVTLINVWATFCGPCLQEMPDLAKLSEEYKDQGVQIIGVVSDVLNSSAGLDASQLDTARTIIDKTGANYPHLLPSLDLLSSGLLSNQAVPATLFVDSNGNPIGKGYLGARSKEQWKQLIEEKLAEQAKTASSSEVAS